MQSLAYLPEEANCCSSNDNEMRETNAQWCGSGCPNQTYKTQENKLVCKESTGEARHSFIFGLVRVRDESMMVTIIILDSARLSSFNTALSILWVTSCPQLVGLPNVHHTNQGS